MKEQPNVVLVIVSVAIVLVVLAFALSYATNTAHEKYIREVNTLFQEYNVNLTPVGCINIPIGYYCTVDAGVKVSKELNFELLARGDVLLVNENNKLILIKPDPKPDDPVLLYARDIPNYIKEALSKFTLVVGNTMYCRKNKLLETGNDKILMCYIPTNVAPLGNTSIFYAPLFRIEEENNVVKSVIVYV